MPDAAPPAETPPDRARPGAGSDRGRHLITADHADLVRAALIVVFVLLGLLLLWEARLLALTAFLGILFGLGASPGVDALERRGLRRGFGAPIIVFGALAAILAIGAWSAPTLVDQSRELRTRFPQAIQKGELWLADHQPRLLDAITSSGAPRDSSASPDSASTDMTVGPATANGQQGRIVNALYEQAPRLKSLALGILQSTLAAFAGFVLVIFLAVYIAAEPDLYRRGILLLFAPRTRTKLAPVLDAIAVKLRRWLATQGLAMLVIGAVTTAAMTAIGVRAAVPLGVIAGLLEFIPNIGPTLSAVPAIAMGFVDSPQKAGIVVVAYWGIQFLENNLLIPYLMKEQLDLPPALTMMTQVVMAYVFGILGLFAATPLLAAVFVAVQMLHVVPDEEAQLAGTVGARGAGAVEAGGAGTGTTT